MVLTSYVNSHPENKLSLPPIDIAALQPLLEKIHRRLHPPQGARGMMVFPARLRARRIFRATLALRSLAVARAFRRNFRTLPQKMPSLAVFFVPCMIRFRTQTHRFLPLDRARRNDVPHVFRNHVRRQKIEFPAGIRLVVLSHGARVATAGFENCRFYLHTDEAPRTPNHKVIAPRISPRSAHRQPVLARPRHKHRLHPLAPSLRIFNNRWFDNPRFDNPWFDNPRFPLLHPPRPRKQKAASGKKLANAASSFNSTGTKTQRQENQKKKWEQLPKRESGNKPRRGGRQ